MDLPGSQHMKNVGGSDGLGLCVFTSIQHSARWQHVTALDGFRAWMEGQPGGGYPQKVDKMLSRFCAEKGVTVPDYVQHTGGDVSFLELAIRTGRCPGVTYDGRDDFYRGRIAHMVSLAHIDSTSAAIIDNNRPGKWVWMSRADFVSRWKGNGGGWAFVLLAPPPPAYPAKPEALACRCRDGGPCDCDGCACPKVFGQCSGGSCCPNGRCPLVAPPAPLPLWAPGPNTLGGKPLTLPLVPMPTGPQPVGERPSARHYWGKFPDGGWGWRLRDDRCDDLDQLAGDVLTGVERDKVHSGSPHYSRKGQPITAEEASAALTDDSNRWHLAAVGAPELLAAVKRDADQLAGVAGKLHVTLYAPTDWQVAQFKLGGGVTLRTPGSGRVGADVGQIAAADYTAAKLAELMCLPTGPTPAPPKKPDPKQPNDQGGGKQPTDSTPWLLYSSVIAAVLAARGLGKRQ